MSKSIHQEVSESVDPGFQERKYCILKSFIPNKQIHELLDHALEVSQHPAFLSGDEQVPRTPAVYADPAMERLLEALVPRLEQKTGISIYPTYSYFRVYKKGDELKKHTDRPACEISLTISLGHDPEIYPIWVDAGAGPIEVFLEPGDALLYRGTEVLHWRESFDGDYAAQLFLHYVDQNGPHGEWKYDRRESLFTLG